MSEPRGGRGGWQSHPGSGSFSLASPNCFPGPKQVATEQGWGVGGAPTAPTPLLSALISRNIPTSVMGRQPAPRRRQSPRKCKHILAAPRPSSHKVVGSLGPPTPLCTAGSPAPTILNREPGSATQGRVLSWSRLVQEGRHPSPAVHCDRRPRNFRKHTLFKCPAVPRKSTAYTHVSLP